MFSKHDSIQRDQLVPSNHLVRKIDAAINLKKMANLRVQKWPNIVGS
ncbi:hypothetical protein [Peribacillus simplex]|nr:hypothetical protein [Peribacillus simplex]MDR4928360.1 hypothetical protein [Peribacillus simplex]WHX92116.1 hypothetical protein QNH50_04375 [Peribacillus simplex]